MAKMRPKRVSEVSAGDQRCTPPWLVQELAQRYAGGFFDLDVAATDETAQAIRWFTREQDGLTQDWGPLRHVDFRARSRVAVVDRNGDDPTRVWLQPPWSNISPWVDKAITEVNEGRCSVVVGLLPSRTGTEWYAKLEREAELIKPIRGRVNFPNPLVKTSSNPEDVIVCVLRPPLVVAKMRPAKQRAA